jgi:hypothetical protein
LSKYLLLLFIFLSVSVKSQINDTVKVILPVDTLRTDTMSVTDSLALADTLALLSDSISIQIADTIKPLYQKPLYSYSRFVSYRDFVRRSSNYPGDIFTLSPFMFDVNPGIAGHPANLLIYGTGTSQTSFLVNGMNYNDYSEFPFDLNRLQIEYIDSAEIIPLPRGFLYSPNMLSASVNFIGKDFISVTPYTKIKYSEGPFGEGTFDGMFNSVVSRSMNLFVQISNRKADVRFPNTDFGKWNARVQLKYLLNNNFNFITGYEYSNTYTGLYGGINISGLNLQNNDFYEELYTEIGAPVIYNNIRFNTFSNTVFLKTLGSFKNFSFTDLTFYYRFNRIELNQPSTTLNHLDNLFKNKISGAALKQHFNYSIFNLNLLGSLETGRIDEYQGFSPDISYSNLNTTNFSLAGIFSLSLLDSLIHPSVYYKLNSEKYISSEIYSGYGADISLRAGNYTRLYAGASRSESRFLSGNFNNLQTGFEYGHSDFKTGLSLFSRTGNITHNYPDTILNMNSSHYYPDEIAGICLDMNVHISRIQLEGKVDFYRENNNEPSFVLPSMFAAGGLYFRDSLFTGNLDLKAGLSFFYYGRRNLNITPDQFAVFRNTSAGPDFRLDLFISGEIQSSAVIFFIWENLLNTRYFLVPFYPMPPRGVRFGVNWELFN